MPGVRTCSADSRFCALGRRCAPKFAVRLFCSAHYSNKTHHSNTRTAPHAMPRKAKTAKAAPGSLSQDTEGGRSQPESTICGDAGPLSSPFGASLESESSVSPLKGGCRRQPASKQREEDAGTEGTSWQGQSAASALGRHNAGRSTKVDAAPTGLSELSFAQVSAGRGEKVKRTLPLFTGQAAPCATAANVKAPLKAAPAPSRQGKSQPPCDAAPLSAGDQQTQDAAGQEAAPPMLFQVNIGTCHVCARHVFCVCCLSDWHCGVVET